MVLKQKNTFKTAAKLIIILTIFQVSVAKPDPEIFQLAASKFDSARPDQVLVFEDAPLGVESALSANMKCVWISQSEPVWIVKFWQ